MNDIGLYRFKNFYDRYFEYCKTNTQQRAYELVEEDFKKTFGYNRYASYKSFRRVYERKLFGVK